MRDPPAAAIRSPAGRRALRKMDIAPWEPFVTLPSNPPDLSGSGQLHIAIGGQVVVVPFAAGQSLLVAAEAAGVKLPANCRRGICGACIVRLDFGTVAMPADCRVLSKRDRQRCFILACQALPTSSEIRIGYEER
jgi:ferredoxin